MARHLWNCPACQRPIEVEPRQAGQVVTCPACQAGQTAPTFRQIGQLPLANDGTPGGPETAGRPTPALSGRRDRSLMLYRWLFVAGVLMCLGGSLATALLFRQAALNDREIPVYELTEAEQQELDRLSLSGLLSAWDQLSSRDMESWEEHDTLAARRLAANQRLGGWIAAGLAVLGLIALLSAVFGERSHRHNNTPFKTSAK